MKVAKSLVVLCLCVVVVFAWVLGRPSEGGVLRLEFGKPLEGLGMDQRRLFRDGREAFQETEDADDGLGPIFNDNSCVACHFSPTVGGSSPINETRAARIEGGFYTELPGGSLFQSNAIRPDCAEVVPSEANNIVQRQTQPLFGLGLVEAIPDAQIKAYALAQAAAHPELAGRVAVIFDVASSRRRVGRFGWKNQQATLLAFAGDAYLNEMGVTSRLFPTENAPNDDRAKLARCDAKGDPEDEANDIEAFANFMRLLAPPPRDSDWDVGWDHSRGRRRGFFARGHDRDQDKRHGPFRNRLGMRLFEKIGCEACHHSGYTTESPIEAIDGQTVDSFSDYLLHDIGTGDGIIQAAAQGHEFRTPPLWGLSESAPYLHDGSAATVEQAIARHANQGAYASRAFSQLSFAEQQALLSFLDSI